MKKTPDEIINDIKIACDLLGWRIAICDNQIVNGLIIGDLEYINNVVSQLDNLDDYDITAVSDETSDLH